MAAMGTKALFTTGQKKQYTKLDINYDFQYIENMHILRKDRNTSKPTIHLPTWIRFNKTTDHTKY